MLSIYSAKLRKNAESGAFFDVFFCELPFLQYLTENFSEKRLSVQKKVVPLQSQNRGVAQLVVYLVWDQVVARSSRVTPTQK